MSQTHSSPPSRKATAIVSGVGSAARGRGRPPPPPPGARAARRGGPRLGEGRGRAGLSGLHVQTFTLTNVETSRRRLAFADGGVSQTVRPPVGLVTGVEDAPLVLLAERPWARLRPRGAGCAGTQATLARSRQRPSSASTTDARSRARRSGAPRRPLSVQPLSIRPTSSSLPCNPSLYGPPCPASFGDAVVVTAPSDGGRTSPLGVHEVRRQLS